MYPLFVLSLSTLVLFFVYLFVLLSIHSSIYSSILLLATAIFYLLLSITYLLSTCPHSLITYSLLLGYLYIRAYTYAVSPQICSTPPKIF